MSLYTNSSDFTCHYTYMINWSLRAHHIYLPSLSALTNTPSVVLSLAVVKLPESRLARAFIPPALQVTAGQSAAVLRDHVTPLQYWEDGS